ncbi:DUF2982 domain-containing protein [Thalassotalea sp. 1_MG-2023]|uniref:DUF2982 domain-containing protein n=1 Tax=Thalassotalea sp. 1_MG-2023 TaxID=3062680 RepID=UPI0026E17435|nr:DUF2982 domain-containing protein [Thalassotalea sp. 1_MG-2023]MDO6425947.1 DUF2982 domain-containing protein [Thalassotalea sp. 1_MG-2023]
MTSPIITIKPKAKCHGLFITLASLVALLIITLFSQFYWQQARFVLMFLILASIAGITLGVLKLLEPKTSFFLSPQCLKFQHRKGYWQLEWQQILAIRPLTNARGIVLDDLNYIGLAIDNIDTFKDKISARLANHLIHEQRPLVTYCVANKLIKPEQAVINFEPYKCNNGEQIKGPIAGFLHQCQTLKQALGAHLFITDGNIDRSLTEFAALLRDCKTSSEDYIKKAP